MAERVNAERGLVDAWTASLGGPKTAALLDRLDKAVAWETLVGPIVALPEYRGRWHRSRESDPVPSKSASDFDAPGTCPQPGSVKRSGDDGLGQRNGWHYDINGSNTVDSSDPWVWFVHDDRWRQVATFRGSDADPKERFVHHNAGLDGFGGSSYLDSVILTDRDQRTGTGGTSDLPWGSAADGTCETRTYLLQNWRADTSVLMKATSGGGVVLQRIKYSPYGTPERLFGIQDFNKDGFVEFTDFDDFVAAFENGEPSSDVNQDGFLDFSDFDAFQGAFEDTSITDGGREIRKLWAGYEAETTDGASGLYHVRHRVYLMELGAWSRRDPIGYVFPSVSLVEYVHSQVTMLIDPTGLQPHISPDGDIGPFGNIPGPPAPAIPTPRPTLQPPTFTGPGWTPEDKKRITDSYNRVYNKLLTARQNLDSYIASLSDCVRSRARQFLDEVLQALDDALYQMESRTIYYSSDPPDPGDVATTRNSWFSSTTRIGKSWRNRTDSMLDDLLMHETMHRREGIFGKNHDDCASVETKDKDGKPTGGKNSVPPQCGFSPYLWNELANKPLKSVLDGSDPIKKAREQCGE